MFRRALVPVFTVAAAVVITGCGPMIGKAAQQVVAQATTGPSVPPGSSIATGACKAVRGDFARDDNWDRPKPAWQLYECDNVPYLGNDGSLYQLNLRYDSRLRLIAPHGVIGYVTRRQCAHAHYPQADVNPGPGIWSPALRICMPTNNQLSTMAG